MRRFLAGLAGVAVLVVLAAAPSPARAEGSAKEFLERIDAGNTLMLFVLSGYRIGMEWANTDLEQRGLPMLFCVPVRVALTEDQTIDILRRFVDERGAVAADLPAGLALLFALKDAFPCNNA